jgi:hypothetical protein
MRQAIILALLAVIVVAAAGSIVARSLEATLPPEARVALDRYLTSENAVASQLALVGRIVHAVVPSRFDATFGSTSIGASFYFRTTRGYRSAAIPNPLILTTSSLPSGATDGSLGARALPFPPADLWCVLLDEVGGKGRAVFLALHEDMYNADWIVHETPGAPGDTELTARLATVGCNLVD